jgi:transcriptional regulator with XRE-family HTH domain
MTAATRSHLERAPSPSRYLRAHLICERARKRFSQAELAKRANVARYTVVRLESGEETNPRLEILARLAAALDVPLHVLLEPIDPPVDASDAELVRRLQTPRSEYIDADDLFAALDEATGTGRYSKRGRKRVASPVPSVRPKGDRRGRS